MTNVVDLHCITTADIPSDKILEAAKTQLSDVLVLGWTKDGKFYAASSEADLAKALYLASKFIHKVHTDYEPS